MKVGVFIPIGNNGWIISSTSPQYMPTFDLNREIVQRAERHGLDFALSMIKLRGFGGKTQYWDYNLESFTLMAGIAAVTQRIQLFASVAILTVPPAVIARMATTIDSIAPGRFGVNIVSGWQKAEYTQMGIWPGDDYFGYRYEYASEYVQVMKDLWGTGHSDFKGTYFQMDDCHMRPRPSRPIQIVSAGQSDRGMRFVSEHCDYNFVGGVGFNETTQIAATLARLRAATAGAGREIGAFVLTSIIAAESDAAAMRKLELYRSGLDFEAMQWASSQSGMDKHADANSTAGMITRMASGTPQKLPPPMGLCGSYETIAGHLDAIAAIPGVAGVLLTFDDFLIGIEQFGQQIQPLMKSRQPMLAAA